MRIDAEPCRTLTNLRFADDVVLVASSQRDISKMISDLKQHAARFVLRIHMGKTAVLTNAPGERPDAIKCGDASVKVVPRGGAEKYLGRKLSINRKSQTEFLQDGRRS